MIRNTPGANKEEWVEATVTRSDPPTELLNVAFAIERGVEEDPRFLLRKCQGFFGERVPWRIAVTSTDAMRMRVPASELGMRYHKGNPGMLLREIPESPPCPRSLEIVRVTNEKELRHFSVPYSEAFGIPMFAVRAMFPRVPQAPSLLLVGYEASKPVSCAVLVATQGIAGIYGVGTRPNARRHGYGEAMTWAALDASKEQGCNAGYLTATEMGAPIYCKMGFRKVVDYAGWTKQVSIPYMLWGLFYWLKLAWKRKPAEDAY
jgi:ribosomal protein S18 acetylase RimI-like enzyme